MKTSHSASKVTRDLWKRREKCIGTFYWLRFLEIRFKHGIARIGTME